MAEARDVRLYIYDGNSTTRGKGLSLTGSQTFELDDKKETTPIIEKESKDPLSVVTFRKTITVTKNYKFEVALSKLEYKKKVYEPCRIMATLQVGVIQCREDVTTEEFSIVNGQETSLGANTRIGNYKPVELIGNDKLDLIKGAAVDLEIDNNMVAENYYVHKIRSVYKTISGKTSLFVELTIFSRDKLMTLDKYSRAYTAKKLYTDILSEEAKKFSSVEVANHMQLLKYQETETVNDTDYEVTKRDELRIPYLVQYNESFYQFMVRCANRFGEFLYFEDGKLNLGMQPSETNYYRRDSSGAIVTKNGTNDIIDWATEPNAVQSRYYESVISEGISVEERGHSYLDHKPEYSDAYGSSGGRYNPDPNSAPEWTDQDLEKNKYIEYDEALNEEFRCFGFELLFKCLESSTIAEATTELILDVSKWLLDVHKNNKDYNNLIDYANVQDKKDNYLIPDDQRSGDNYKQFVTYSGSTNLSNNLSNMFNEGGINNFTDIFYRFIRQKEKEVGEEAVWLDFGNYYRPIKLGDKLRVANKDYVAISVEGSYENGQEHLLVSAIPVFSISETEPSPQTATTAGDPWTTSVPLPPALPGVIIRDARPQVAFVAETLDPETLGRIRVRYPWQDENGDMSPWIRVTLPSATTGGAVNFTPSVGDEVMVGYVHGNIEHPYGMGYLTAPFVNERWKNAIPLDQYGGLHGIKVKTGHHLTFSDGANAASFVASIIGGPANFVKNFWPTGLVGAFPLGNEESSDFGGGFELADRYGFYKITGSSDDRNITIQSPLGTVNLNAFQGISIEAPNGDIEIKGKNVSIEAANRLSIKSGENIENKLWYAKKGSAIKTVGLQEIKSGAEAAWSHVYDTFLDMSFLRCLFEWFIIPVNGTLSIKSATFVTIEAGEGKAEVPQESLRYGKGINDELKNITKVIYTTECIKNHVGLCVDSIHDCYSTLCHFLNIYNKTTTFEGWNSNECIITFAGILSKDGNFTVDSTELQWEESCLRTSPENKEGDEPEDKNSLEWYVWNYKKRAPQRNITRRANREKFVDIINNVKFAADLLKEAVELYTDISKDDISINGLRFPDGVNADSLELGDAADAINELTIPTGKGFISLDKMKDQSYSVEDISMPSESAWRNLKQAWSRYAAYKYLSGRSYLNQTSSLISSLSDAYSNMKWKLYTASLEGSVMDKLGDNLVNEYGNPFKGMVDDQLQWSHGFKGKILMSDEENNTSFFDEGLHLTPHPNHVVYEENIKTLRTLLKTL